MASGDVALTAALRSNLLSLQGTQRLLDQTQLRLATGLKVNSALDNPSSFFAAQSLNNRSGDLSNLLDGMGQAVQVLKATDEGIKGITSLLQQAQAIATEARDTLNADSSADVSSFNDAFQEIMHQVRELASDSGYRGTNLLAGATDTTDVQLTVNFAEDASGTGTSANSLLEITGRDFSITGYGGTDGLSLTVDGTVSWTSADAAQTTIDEIKADLDTIRAAAAEFGSYLNVIQTRLDFTQSIINVLKEGADKLTVADKNEEGAKLLSLQTTQQLGITSLSLASQAEQSILRLFG
jgi:flagellin-like hook-associated protein FlgL